LHSDHAEKSLTAADAAHLSDFFHELQVFHKNASAYPPHHPMIKAAKERVMSALDTILIPRDEFSVIVTRTGLFAGKTRLDLSNRVFRFMAEKLFHRGVATITFRKGLGAEELDVFNEIMNLDREGIRQRGGLEKILTERGVRCIRMDSIDYGSFSPKEKEELRALDNSATYAQSANLWKRFIQILSSGMQGRSLQRLGTDGKHRPETLARQINDSFSGRSAETAEVFRHAVDFFTTHLPEICNKEDRAHIVGNFAAFVTALKPDSSGQFVKYVCDCAEEREDVAQEILESIPWEVTNPLLADIVSGTEMASPSVFRILGKIRKNFASTGATPQGPASTDIGNEKLGALSIVLRKDDAEKFVPDEYREQLRKIMPEHILSETTRQYVEEMKSTLAGHILEHSTGLVILELLNTTLDDRQSEQLTGNLLELCTCFLQIGDFASLSAIYHRLQTANTRSDRDGESGYQKIIDTFSQPYFQEEVLNGLTFWGKAKYADIRKLIGKVGKPFASPLLDRLADEQNISMRRCYMECLAEMGEAARDESLARLKDGRWYFVRNVVTLLRGIDDPSILPHIRPLTRYPHAKVRQEAFKTLMHFDDPDTERLLLQDMSSKDRATRLDAIKLAEKSSSPEIFKKLLGFLDKGGFPNIAFDIKTATVQTLAEIGNPDALPALEKLFRSRSLLHPRKHSRLKQEIVRSLSRYPVSSTNEKLQAIARSSRGKLAEVATEVLNNLGDCP
jgi:hypothetical protein